MEKSSNRSAKTGCEAKAMAPNPIKKQLIFSKVHPASAIKRH
ncbi:hypothetical protein [Limnohabitans sp. Rim8]|nr:hypothetical protein [Limnohabitans sp. Rim8]